jgi:uncharacterized membrane protein YdbT with pleckstrin-like domain
LLQRIVGVYELDVDTAGSSKKRREDKSNFTSISFSIAALMERKKGDSEEHRKLSYDNQLLSLLKVGLRLIMSKVLV